MINKKNMKNPLPKVILIIIIVAILAIFVAPKVIEIFDNNIKETGNRAKNS